MQSKFLAILTLTGIACGDSRGPLDPATATGTELQYGAPVALGRPPAGFYMDG